MQIVSEASQAEAMECATAVLQAVMASLKKVCTGVQAARLLVEEAKQARAADKRDVAVKRLAEAEAILKKEKYDEVLMDLAFVDAWRIVTAVEADHTTVRSGAIEVAQAVWSKIIAQLPNSDVPSLRLGLRTPTIRCARVSLRCVRHVAQFLRST